MKLAAIKATTFDDVSLHEWLANPANQGTGEKNKPSGGCEREPKQAGRRNMVGETVSWVLKKPARKRPTGGPWREDLAYMLEVFVSCIDGHSLQQTHSGVQTHKLSPPRIRKDSPCRSDCSS